MTPREWIIPGTGIVLERTYWGETEVVPEGTSMFVLAVRPVAPGVSGYIDVLLMFNNKLTAMPLWWLANNCKILG